MKDDRETEAGAVVEKYRDPIKSYPTQAQTHDEFRQLRRRGFILHNSGNDGQRKTREGETRGKAAKKAMKREMRALREIHQDIAQNGI